MANKKIAFVLTKLDGTEMYMTEKQWYKFLYNGTNITMKKVEGTHSVYGCCVYAEVATE
jgi:hypothetical protein